MKAIGPYSAPTLRRPSFRLSGKALYAAIALVALAASAMLYALDPREPGNYPVCPFLGVTGYHCPGCGTLRTLHAILHADMPRAFGYNPLTVLSLPFLGYAFGVGTLRAFRLPAPARLFIHPNLIWGLALGVVAFWVLRNVPVGPFTFLAP